jgi:hypothetical protein
MGWPPDLCENVGTIRYIDQVQYEMRKYLIRTALSDPTPTCRFVPWPLGRHPAMSRCESVHPRV